MSLENTYTPQNRKVAEKKQNSCKTNKNANCPKVVPVKIDGACVEQKKQVAPEPRAPENQLGKSRRRCLADLDESFGPCFGPSPRHPLRPCSPAPPLPPRPRRLPPVSQTSRQPTPHDRNPGFTTHRPPRPQPALPKRPSPAPRLC